ncbi:hypothetical protein CASFOL_011096 [Castilleja foliolosa]|uniref:Uncharacterized protein n=1 Tax=Castilleja foliolosa TaxID=1961234 RepID=A0ABD3DVX6_9LAMI
MENSMGEKITMEETVTPLLKEDQDSNAKGGFTTLPFIIGNESLEKMATYGVSPNMTLYLMKEYHMGMSSASTVLFLWSSATNFMPLVGAVLADSFLGRFYTIGFGSTICLMGMIILWLTTIIPQAKPPLCDQSISTCITPTIFQFMFLFTSFVLISIGAGGIRSSSLAFGANQLEKGDFKKQSGVKESYFNWYYATNTISIVIALTCVVYIQDNMGWVIGFAVPAGLMFIGVVLFFSASASYVRVKSESSLLTGFAQVVVAWFRNRHVKLSDGVSYIWHCKNGSGLVSPSPNLRFLNKACVIRDPNKDLTADGTAKDPWSLCTVDQVEELKALVRIIPIWSTGMIMSINISQNSFPLLQAVSMDRHITSSFTIPPASFNTFTVIAVILWITIYDRIFLPLASRVKKKPVRISPRRRMGIGIFLSFLAMMVSALVEAIRRAFAVHEGNMGPPLVSSHISALWLVPQYCLNGFAEASNVIAQNEFYFSELPRSMSSIALTLNGIGGALANLIASFIMNMVDNISKAGGKESWISSDINKGHYDYYYLVLAGLSMCNMLYFLVCSRAYGPLKEDTKMREEEDE